MKSGMFPVVLAILAAVFAAVTLATAAGWYLAYFLMGATAR